MGVVFAGFFVVVLFFLPCSSNLECYLKIV